MAGVGNNPVVAIKLSGSTQTESWSEGKLLGGDVVLQVNCRYSCDHLRKVFFDLFFPLIRLNATHVVEFSSRLSFNCV